MEFEWDEAKRLSNTSKHGFDFLDAWQLFEGDHVRVTARVGPTGEERFRATGFVNGAFATLIYTVRGSRIRIISLRKAHINERRQHQALYD